MDTRIFKITFRDGDWLKAELPADIEAAFEFAKENYGADVATVESVGQDDAAAIKHMRAIQANVTSQMAEEKARLELVVKCQPDLLIHHIRHDTAFDADMLALVFTLAKQQARRVLGAATVAKPSEQFEHLDLQNHQLRRAMQKMMARLTELLDEDKFAEVEAIAKSAGVEPPIIESAQ